MLDDIDYSDLSSSAQQAEAKPAKKSTISERKISTASKPKANPKPIDTEALESTTTELQKSIGSPEINDPAVEYGLPVMGGLAALATAYGLYQASQNKGPIITGPAPVPPAPPAPPAPPVAPQQPAPVDRLQQAQQRIEEGRQAGLGAKPTVEVPPGMPSGSDIPPQFPPSPVAPAGNIPPAPVPTYGISAAVASKGDVKQAIQETIAKEIDKPVYPNKTTFKSLAEIPPEFEFRPDVGNIDRSLGNILGLENRAYARDLFNEGKPFGQAGPGKNQLNTEVSELTKRYFQELQSQIPETLLGRDARQAQKIRSEFGTFSKNTDFGKGVKVAGVTGTLFAIPSIVNAAQQGNYGGAAVQAADLATDYLPLIGQIKQALSPSSAGAGSDISPEMRKKQEQAYRELFKLGSPAAQTETGQRIRRDEEMARKIAGRTGSAVPPQFRR